MSGQSIPQMLEQMIGHPPSDALIAQAVHAKSAMPQDMQVSRSAIHAILRELVLRHRLEQCFAQHTASLRAEAQSVVERSSIRAEEAAQRMFTRVLDELLRKAANQHPVAEAARTRARREWAAITALIAVLAFAVLYAGMLLHWVPHPSLDARENAQLAWAQKIDGSGSREAIDWASEELQDLATLQRVQAYAAAIEADRDPVSELEQMRRCRLKDMTSGPHQGRVACWFFVQ